MSAICGILNWNKAPLHSRRLQEMLTAMRNRGPDGIRFWKEGPIGLGHCQFVSTPEDAQDQPLHTPDGRLRLVADARIDNRSELARLLKQKGFLTSSIVPSDAELILAAYQAWGQDCPSRLIGDFAFALWDAREERLFAARDAVGLRQLYYAECGGSFYFGTTIRSVVKALERKPELNPRLIEDFLQDYFDLWVCETIYKGIFRLPPAHSMTVSSAGIQTRLYYVFGSGPTPKCSSAGEWNEAFQELFDESVRCRLRSSTPVAVLVGGGVDSSAVACVASGLRKENSQLPEIQLHAAVFENTPGADEREYFEDVARECSSATGFRVPCDRYWGLSEFSCDGRFPIDEPEIYPTRALTCALLKSSSEQGCRVVLGGEGANQVLGHAVYCTPAAVAGLGWRQVGAEWRYFREATGVGQARLLYHFLTPEVIRHAVSRVRRKRRHRPPWIRTTGSNGDGRGPTLASEFAKPKGLSPSAQVAHRYLRGSFDLARYCALDVTAANCSVEWRLPFLDRRLVEFLMHIPDNLRSWRGRDRIILRESMKGILPESVRRRTDKSSLLELIHKGMRKERNRVEKLLTNCQAEALGFLDVKVLSQEFEKYWSGSTDRLKLLQRPLALEAWLRDAHNRS